MVENIRFGVGSEGKDNLLREYENVISNSTDKNLRNKFFYLSDELSRKQFENLCKACDYDEDTLADFDEQVKEFQHGEYVSSIFYDAMQEDKVNKYIEEYNKFYHGLSNDINLEDDMER